MIFITQTWYNDTCLHNQITTVLIAMNIRIWYALFESDLIDTHFRKSIVEGGKINAIVITGDSKPNRVFNSLSPEWFEWNFR